MKLPILNSFSDVGAFRRDPLNFLLEIDRSDPEPLHKLNLGPAPTYLVTDPELVKPILRFPDTQVDKGRLIQKLRSVIGDSVVILSGDEHKRRRAVLHGLLARQNLESMAPALSAEICRSIAGATRAGQIDAHLFGSALALRMICIMAFGQNVLSTGDEQALVSAVRMIEDDVADEIFRVFPPTPWTAMQQKRRRSHAREIMKTVVTKVQRNADSSEGMRAYASLGLSETDLANEILTVLLAGHHTTGAAVAWVLHALATEPGLADRIAGEAASLTTPDGTIDTRRMASARFSLTLVREIVRLFPSSWWFSRETVQETEIAGRRLAPKTSLLISPWLFHRSPRHWDDPDEFRLDRSYTGPAYLPFGAGPRACVGMTLAMFELQLIALEFASALTLSYGGAKRPVPEPQVMLMPPPIQLDVSVKGQLQEVA